MKQFRFTLVLLLVFPLFVACQEVAIVHDLVERDANEIVVILAKHNIVSKKEKVEKNQEVTWFISVDPGDEMLARSILVANNLPKIRQAGLSGICKDAGLIQTPKTEKCREILAYKGEIINSLESIPGVVTADAVLNIPDKDDFPTENSIQRRPTASVTLQYLKDPNTVSTLTEEKVQQFVSNAVTDLDARDVTVIISYVELGTGLPEAVADPEEAVAGSTTVSETDSGGDDDASGDLLSVGGLKMDEDSAKKFKMAAVGFLVLFLLLTFAFIFVLLRMARIKKQAAKAASVVEDDEEQKLLNA